MEVTCPFCGSKADRLQEGFGWRYECSCAKWRVAPTVWEQIVKELGQDTALWKKLGAGIAKGYQRQPAQPYELSSASYRGILDSID